MMDEPSEHSAETVEMPRPTAAPLVLAVGLALVAAGVILGPAFLIVGAVVLLSGVGFWFRQLTSGEGHVHEPLVEPALRPQPVTGAVGSVERLVPGAPGYRLQLPVKMHPISAGIRGGIFGGLVMPVPALLWGLASGHGIWYPVNLLAGMMLPGVEEMTVPELEQFSPALVVTAIVIHAVMSVVFGLIYGVLLPTLAPVPKPLAWGGLLMPLLWTAFSFALMGIVNPLLAHQVSWFWFIVSQFIFGLVSACVFMQLTGLGRLSSGLVAGVAGGLVMPAPAFLWGLASGHGIWYPVNLLAGMVIPGLADAPLAELERFHPGWMTGAIVLHAILSLSFGLAYSLVLPRVPEIPGPVAWGGLVMPLLWTAVSYGLMGIVNPLLQQQVDWPWFAVSQFVFGVAAAVVVLRSQMVYIPPRGTGPSGTPAEVTR